MKIKSLIYIGSLLVLFACNDESFYERQRVINPTVIDIADMENVVSGTYYAMTGNQGNESNFDAFAVVAAAISDESRFVNEAGANSDVEGFYLRNNLTDNGITNSVFSACYKSIANINQFLPILEKGELRGLPNENQLPRMQGELYFLRAYNYYILAKLFANPHTAANNSRRYFPLRTEPIYTISDANQSAAPIEDVYQQIVKDLKDAVELLPLNAENQFPSYQFGRANKFAALALQARVYLQMGSFADALEACNTLIELKGDQYDLSQTPIESWNKSWEGGGKDVIWSYSMGNTSRMNGLGGTSQNWKLPRRFSFFNYSTASSVPTMPGNSQGSMSAASRTLAISDVLLNKAGWINSDRTPTQKARNDLRFTQLIWYNAGADPTFSRVAPHQYWVNKYWRGPQEHFRVGAVPLIRLSEVYLTRAILRFMENDKQGAADDLNAVRRRAWNAEAAGVPYTDVTAAEITAEMIHTERMIELMFESDRPYYLQGLKTAIPNGDRESGGSIPFDSENLYWPIPIRETELNQGLGIN
jgi:starch-binding outer membrane protein, SusD/RagB family